MIGHPDAFVCCSITLVYTACTAGVGPRIGGGCAGRFHHGNFPQSESAVGNAADEALKIEYLAGL
jgi:hypothetical protein